MNKPPPTHTQKDTQRNRDRNTDRDRDTERSHWKEIREPKDGGYYMQPWGGSNMASSPEMVATQPRYSLYLVPLLKINPHRSARIRGPWFPWSQHAI